MPASLGTLPTELLRLIIELAVPPESLVFAQAKRRREALVPLSHVSKRFCSVVRPLLRRLVVNTVVDSKSARNAKKELREQAVAMIFCTRQWEKPEFSVAWHERMILAEKEFPAVLGALPSVRYASFVGAAQDSHRTPVSLVLGSNSPYLNLKGLHYQNCTTQVTVSTSTGPYSLSNWLWTGSCCTSKLLRSFSIRRPCRPCDGSALPAAPPRQTSWQTVRRCSPS
ncbi:RHTO0S08e06370g1_1 [Rhodotorula toruloides]|uniref:RHTO0S08e06370g1_1 n=1 Tax=Rhodotorula toruloides TaxID=5286 RepID=A0A061B2X7_RHOTO|nr:RHTO0S08e06370g1_1 [Rhodotorula toruloides]